MKIIVYTKTGCGWCKEVLDFFDQNSIKYEERQVLANKQHLEELIEKSGQLMTPTVDIDGTILSNTDRNALYRWFVEKGLLL